jgi:hypothetical protein
MRGDGNQSEKPHVPEGEILVGVGEISQFLRLNARTISNLIKRDALPVRRCGLGWVSTKGAIIRWLERRLERGNDG